MLSLVAEPAITIPKIDGRGRPRLPEELKKSRKHNRNKVIDNNGRPTRIDSLKRFGKDRYLEYNNRVRSADDIQAKRTLLEKQRSQNNRNKVKINKLKTKSTEPTLFQSPNANILQEVSCIDNETGKQFIVNFLTSDKKLSDEKKQAITEKALSSSPNTVVRNVFHIKQAENTVKARLGPNERSTHKKIRNQLEGDLKKDSLLLLDEEDDIHQKEQFISYFRKELATPKLLSKLIDENTSSLNLSGVDIIASQFKKLGLPIIPERTSVQDYRNHLSVGLLYELRNQSTRDFDEVFVCDVNLIVLPVKCFLILLIKVFKYYFQFMLDCYVNLLFNVYILFSNI